MGLWQDCIFPEEMQMQMQMLIQRGRDTQSNATSSSESNGAAFLTRVKEKLRSAEYRDFVECMKALRSRAMKVNNVLQSIANRFSGPDGLPLRRRFKDYLPVNYHSLYEKYFGESGGTTHS